MGIGHLYAFDKKVFIQLMQLKFLDSFVHQKDDPLIAELWADCDGWCVKSHHATHGISDVLNAGLELNPSYGPWEIPRHNFPNLSGQRMATIFDLSEKARYPLGFRMALQKIRHLNFHRVLPPRMKSGTVSSIPRLPCLARDTVSA